MKRILWTGILAMAVATQFSCQSSQSRGENTLFFENSTEPEHLDSTLVYDSASDHVVMNLFDGLVIMHPRTVKPIPGLAEKWDVSPDGKTYTFHLRANIKWSDGTPITAQQFVDAWQRAADPATASQGASRMYYVKNGQAINEGKIKDLNQLGVRALDDRTLQVTLEAPFPPFLQLLYYSTFAPIRKELIAQHGDKWTRPEHMVNSGPFTLKEWVPGRHIILARNPHYWDQQHVYLDKVVMLPNEDHATQVKAFQSGSIDWMEQVPVNLVEQVRHLPEYSIDPMFAEYYYITQVTDPALKDVRIRRALGMAIDRTILAEKYMKGQVRSATMGLIPPGIPGYPYSKLVEFNPEGAKKLLAEAGYPDPSTMPPLTLIYNTNENHKLIAEVIQQMWKQNLGISVNLQNMEWKTLLKQLQGHNFQVARLGGVGEYVYPSTVLENYLTGSANNYGNWSNIKFDSLWKLASQTADPTERLQIYAQMEKIVLDDGVVYPLYYYMLTTMTQRWVKGLYPTLNNMRTLHWVWVIPHNKVGRSWDTVLEYTRIPWPSRG